MKKIFYVIIGVFLLLNGCAVAKKDESRSAPQQMKNPVQVKKLIRTPVQVKKIRTPDLAGGPENRVREPHPLTLADLRAKYASHFILHGPKNKRQVALTFDDGPDLVFTPKVLDMLKKHNVKATFFIIGNRAAKHPEMVKRIIREGHVIGNHTYTHPNLPKIKNDREFQSQIKRTETVLKQLSGYSPKLFRPPYGAVNENQIKWLISQKMLIVNWNVDSLDWKGLSADQVADNVLSNIFPGAIVLQHSAGGYAEDLSGSVKALDKIIRKLKADGVKFVTVPELLNVPKMLQ